MTMPQPAPDAVTAHADAHDAAAWREGFRTGLPTLFGIAAWGLVVGIAMIKTGLTIPQALGMTLLVFAGSAQLASLPLIVANAPVWVIFATALVVNLRFVIFSVLLAPHFAHLPWKQRFALGYVSGDMTVALFLQRFPSEQPVPGKLSYLKGLMYPNWVAWQVGSIAGIFLGSAVPTAVGPGLCRHAGDHLHHGAAGGQQGRAVRRAGGRRGGGAGGRAAVQAGPAGRGGGRHADRHGGRGNAGKIQGKP